MCFLLGDGFFAAVDSPGGGFNLAVDSCWSGDSSAAGGGGIFAGDSFALEGIDSAGGGCI